MATPFLVFKNNKKRKCGKTALSFFMGSYSLSSEELDVSFVRQDV